ncbi:unnamed protein product [Rotaria socialis]
MKSYDLRINRPKTGDGFFKRLHLGQYTHDILITVKTRGPSKTRWLRGIAAHIQQVIFKATSDRAKGEKRVGKISLSNTAVVQALENIGIQKRWVVCPDLIELLHLNTSFIVGDYIKKAHRLEFKLVHKVCHYFDTENQSQRTSAAHFLFFRLLKETTHTCYLN